MFVFLVINRLVIVMSYYFSEKPPCQGGHPRSAPGRWDGRDVSQYEGTYGDYLIAKVSKVFPELAQRTALHM